MDGKVHVDTEHAAYYGNSLGGIMGEVYMASTTAIKKGTYEYYRVSMSTLASHAQSDILYMISSCYNCNIIRCSWSWWWTVWYSSSTKCGFYCVSACLLVHIKTLRLFLYQPCRFEVALRVLYPDPVDWCIMLAFANMLWSR